MSYRELWVFIQHLPQESWTQTILRDEQFKELINPATTDEAQSDKFGPWALVNYQIAALTDAVNQLGYLTAVVGRLEPKPKPPQPMARPGLNRLVRRQSEAGVAYLKNLRGTG